MRDFSVFQTNPNIQVRPRMNSSEPVLLTPYLQYKEKFAVNLKLSKIPIIRFLNCSIILINSTLTRRNFEPEIFVVTTQLKCGST